MSSIAEHLAAFEMYKANGMHEQAWSEGYLFLSVHWKDLIAAQADMAEGRAALEARLREQHGARAEAYIERWHAGIKEIDE